MDGTTHIQVSVSFSAIVFCKDIRCNIKPRIHIHLTLHAHLFIFLGCWLSGVDINTQQSFEALSERAVAVVVDPIQSVKGKVVIGNI